MEILVRLANNYGNKVVYPVCDKAKMFARIADTKTLTSDTIACVKQLGYAINVEQQTI